MILHSEISGRQLLNLIKNNKVVLAGNLKLKIYGDLGCKSGKRMKKENRVFFSSDSEAKEQNFRPCGHCMSSEYKKWSMQLFDYYQDEKKTYYPRMEQ